MQTNTDSELWLLAELAPIQQKLIDYINKEGLGKELPKSLQTINTIQTKLTFDSSLLQQLCQRMDLSYFERQLLLLSIGAVVMPQFSQLYTIIFSDQHADCPTFDLAMQLFPSNRQALTPQAPLRHWQLITLQKTSSFMHSPYAASERLLHYLYGSICIDPCLIPYLTLLTIDCIPAQHYQRSAQQMVRYWQTDNSQQLAGQLIAKSSADAEQVAVHIARELYREIWRLDLVALFTDYDPVNIAQLQHLLQRELLLSDLIITIDCSVLNDTKPQQLHFIQHLIHQFPKQILLSACLPIAKLNSSTFIEEIKEFSWAEQLALWQQGLAVKIQ